MGNNFLYLYIFAFSFRDSCTLIFIDCATFLFRCAVIFVRGMATSFGKFFTPNQMKSYALELIQFWEHIIIIVHTFSLCNPGSGSHIWFCIHLQRNLHIWRPKSRYLHRMDCQWGKLYTGPGEGLKIWGPSINARSFNKTSFASNSVKLWGRGVRPPHPTVPPLLV